MGFSTVTAGIPDDILKMAGVPPAPVTLKTILDNSQVTLKTILDMSHVSHSCSCQIPPTHPRFAGNIPMCTTPRCRTLLVAGSKWECSFVSSVSVDSFVMRP
jgi:hypothetical protein